MKQTIDEITGDVLRYKAERGKAQDEVEAMVYRWAMGNKARVRDLMELVSVLQSAEFVWGQYDAAFGIMKANKAVAIEDGRLLA